MKDEAQKLDFEGERVSAESIQIARDGELLLPRLDLCTSIVDNYRVKIDAARHKASLLKNMSLVNCIESTKQFGKKKTKSKK